MKKKHKEMKKKTNKENVSHHSKILTVPTISMHSIWFHPDSKCRHVLHWLPRCHRCYENYFANVKSRNSKGVKVTGLGTTTEIGCPIGIVHYGTPPDYTPLYPNSKKIPNNHHFLILLILLILLIDVFVLLTEIFWTMILKIAVMNYVR